MRTNNVVVVLLALHLAACSPLQQAPLVYSSKVSVGVDVSATSTETPGAGISIGYKQVDAAYVPVAVAKKCEPLNDEKCTGETFKLLALNGRNQQEDGAVPTETELSNASAEAARASDALKLRQDAIATANLKYEATKKIADSLESLKKAEAALKAEATIPGDLPKVSAQVQAAEEAKAQLVADSDAVIAAKAARDSAAISAQKAAEVYQNKLAASRGRNQNAKQDAFSVFGTFNADAATSVGVKQDVTGGLKLGKVFSTGVASQNLTEGMKLYYASMAPGSCLEKIVKVVEFFPADERSAAAKKLLSICETIK